MNARVCEHVDFRMEQVFQILTEPDEIEQRSSRLHFDKQIEITAGTVFPQGCGAEHSNIARSVTRGDLQDVWPFVP